MFGRKKKTNNNKELTEALLQREKEYKEQLAELKEAHAKCDELIKELRKQLLIFEQLKP